MPIYEYQHEESGEILEVEMSMSEDHPKTVRKNGKTYHRVIGLNTSTVIPYGFVKDYNEVSFNKSPSRKKHYW